MDSKKAEELSILNTNDIKELTNLVKIFCEDRDWNQYHNPKDLAIGISTEANELLDIFRFKSDEDMKALMNNDKKLEAVSEELADIFFFLLRFCQMNNINLGEALIDKLDKNNQKYPVDKIKGKNIKYTEL